MEATGVLLAEKLHDSAVVVDGHCDSVHLFCGLKGPYRFAGENRVGHVDLPRLKKGGVNIQFFALYIEPEFTPHAALERTKMLVEHFYREVRENKEKVSVVLDWQGVEKTLAVDKLAAVLTLEGGEALNGSVGVLQELFGLGLRGLGLTWNGRNLLADGVGVSNAGGLTDCGREIVREMNRLGMLVDAAHLAPRGFYELLDCSAAPVVVTHANAAAICKHRRNLDDGQLRILREKGGVVGMSFYPPFIHDRGHASLDHLLDHFCYIAEHFGVEILGLGSDYDGIPEAVAGLDDVSRLPVLTRGLLARGFSAEEVRKILGGNFLRVMKNVFPHTEAENDRKS